MRFDAPTFARAWLSIAQASASKDDAAPLNRTVALEEYPVGVRLVATDRFVLLTAWVPDLEHYYGHTEPTPDEAPDRTVVLHDGDGRGKGLLSYALKLDKREDPDGCFPPGRITLDLTHDVRLPAGQEPDQAFEGMDPTYTVLSMPDLEKVYLRVIDSTYPDWRPLILDHAPEETKAIALNPELVQRVCGAARWIPDDTLTWTFGGSEKPAVVDFLNSDPHVQGVVMPRRWVLDGEPDPDEDDEPAEDPADYHATTDEPAGLRLVPSDDA